MFTLGLYTTYLGGALRYNLICKWLKSFTVKLLELLFMSQEDVDLY